MCHLSSDRASSCSLPALHKSANWRLLPTSILLYRHFFSLVTCRSRDGRALVFSDVSKRLLLDFLILFPRVLGACGLQPRRRALWVLDSKGCRYWEWRRWLSGNQQNGNMHPRRPAVSMVIRPALSFYNGAGGQVPGLGGCKGVKCHQAFRKLRRFCIPKLCLMRPQGGLPLLFSLCVPAAALPSMKAAHWGTVILQQGSEQFEKWRQFTLILFRGEWLFLFLHSFTKWLWVLFQSFLVSEVAKTCWERFMFYHAI